MATINSVEVPIYFVGKDVQDVKDRGPMFSDEDHAATVAAQLNRAEQTEAYSVWFAGHTEIPVDDIRPVGR